MNEKYANSSLKDPGSPRSVLTRMAADVERAKRIRERKLERPDLTWRRIADGVGVSERAAMQWRKTGGIAYPNCARLAVILGVDADWLWRGPHETPDLMGALSVSQRLDRLERKLDELLDHRIERAIGEDDEPGARPAAGR